MSLFVTLSMFKICDQPWPNDALYLMRSLFDLIMENLSSRYPDKFALIKETWRVTQEDGWSKSDRFYKVYSPEIIGSWGADMREIKKDIRYMRPTLRCKLGRRKFDIDTGLGLARARQGDDADPHPLPTRSERHMFLILPKDIFLKMDQSVFVEAFSRVCARLGVTYAVIDDMRIASASSIEQFTFERETAPLRAGKPQITLPTIAWWQYIAPPMGERTGTLGMIQENCPCFRAQRYAFDGNEGLSIQLTEDLKDATLEKRMGLRVFFKDSLNPLPIDTVTYAMRLNPDWLEYLPITEDERREALERIQMNEKG